MSFSCFSKLSLEDSMLRNLSSLGYKEMTPIQAESLEYILKNNDVLAQSSTGSGKTAAFGIGLISQVDVTIKSVQTLVLCPTRELAEQVSKEIRRLARMKSNMKVLTLCGGTPIYPQVSSLHHGAHCIVGTPGRIQDHIRKGSLDLQCVKTLVLDEADRMLDMGFADVLDQIITKVPRHRQTLLFSATYPSNIKLLSKSLQKNPVVIKVEDKNLATNIDQQFYEVEESHKVDLLTNLLFKYKPESSIVFCNTKHKCQQLAADLNKKGFYAQATHGDLEQRDRDQVLVLFASKSTSILVATDVAARGLDIKDLTAVINFDLSKNPEVHVHRIGRTGRAGNKGMAFSFVSKQDHYKLKEITEYQDKKFNLIKQTISKTNHNPCLKPPMVSLRINGGKKNKLRAGDILGALTVKSTLLGKDIGKIDIFDYHSYVAISKVNVDIALQLLLNDKIKGRAFKVKKMTIDC